MKDQLTTFETLIDMEGDDYPVEVQVGYIMLPPDLEIGRRDWEISIRSVARSFDKAELLDWLTPAELEQVESMAADWERKQEAARENARASS